MGQIEKIFVISIVLLVAIVLGVTILSRGGDSGGPNYAAGAEKPGSAVVDEGQDPLGMFRMLDPANQDLSRAEGGPSAPTADLAGTSEIPRPEKPDPAPPPPKPPVIKPEPVPDFPYVRVKANETLGQILERELGSAVRFLAEVQELNEDLDPNHLRVDQRIWLPRARVLAQQTPSLRIPAGPSAPTPAQPALRTYTVLPKDSLWTIAVKQLPSVPVKEAMQRIRGANPGKKLEPLAIGLVLNLPR